MQCESKMIVISGQRHEEVKSGGQCSPVNAKLQQCRKLKLCDSGIHIKAIINESSHQEKMMDTLPQNDE